jgi:hypothetical protein
MEFNVNCSSVLRMSISRIFPVLLIITTLVSSCKNSLDRYGEDFHSFMRYDEGLFRGANIGDNQEKVRSNEGLAPSSFDENTLTFAGGINAHAKYTVNYGFEEDKLFEISAEVKTDSVGNSTGLNQAFVQYYTNQFGAPVSDRGFLVWTIPMNNEIVQIEMSDEGEAEETGIWTLNIYKKNP